MPAPLGGPRTRSQGVVDDSGAAPVVHEPENALPASPGLFGTILAAAGRAAGALSPIGRAGTPSEETAQPAESTIEPPQAQELSQTPSGASVMPGEQSAVRQAITFDNESEVGAETRASPPGMLASVRARASARAARARRDSESRAAALAKAPTRAQEGRVRVTEAQELVREAAEDELVAVATQGVEITNIRAQQAKARKLLEALEDREAALAVPPMTASEKSSVDAPPVAPSLPTAEELDVDTSNMSLAEQLKIYEQRCEFMKAKLAADEKAAAQAAATEAARVASSVTTAVSAPKSPQWADAIEASLGSLQKALIPAGGKEELLAHSLWRIDILEPSDVSVLHLDALREELKSVGFNLSKVMWLKLKAVADKIVSDRAAVADKATKKKPKTPQRDKNAKSVLLTAVGDSEDLDESELVGLPSDVEVDPMAEPDVSLVQEPSKAKARVSSVLPEYVSTPLMQHVLERLTSVEVNDEQRMLHLFTSLLKLAEKVPIDAEDIILVAEQVDHLFSQLDVDGQLAGGTRAAPRDGAVGVRALLRELLDSRALQKDRDTKKIADDEASAKKVKDDEEASRRMWDAEQGRKNADKTLEHMRARERIAATINSPEALKALDELYAAIGSAKGEQAFLNLNQAAQRNHSELATLLHHEHFPTASSGALAAFASKGGLGGLERALGEPVALPVETQAWVAMAAHDVQEYTIKAAAKTKMKDVIGDKVDHERLLRATFFGKLAVIGASATGNFRLSELTNPADPTSLIAKNANADDARKLLENIYPLALALTAMHPTDEFIHDTMAEVAKACRQDSEDISPTLVNAIYGAFLRAHSSAWSDFQTMDMAIPDVTDIWASAQEGKAIDTAHRQVLKKALETAHEKLAAQTKKLETLEKKEKAHDERIKRLEQAKPARAPSTGAIEPGGANATSAGGKSLKDLKSDVYHSKRRATEAKEAADKAEADGASDAAAKKTESDRLASELAKAEAALANHKPASK